MWVELRDNLATTFVLMVWGWWLIVPLIPRTIWDATAIIVVSTLSNPDVWLYPRGHSDGGTR